MLAVVCTRTSTRISAVPLRTPVPKTMYTWILLYGVWGYCTNIQACVSVRTEVNYEYYTYLFS